MDNVLRVKKIEHHYWKTCPCSVCKAYCKERSTIPHSKNHRALSVKAAHILGFIPKRCESGSLARGLMQDTVPQ